MCGICGLIAPDGFPDLPAASRQVDAMLRALSHRGPDASEQVTTERAVLGATRLAIRGLEDGPQPMVDADTGLVTVCNGEIDNHRELRRWLAERGRPVQAQTDVAVVPGLFLELGEGFVSKLVGAFAVAIWDPRTGQLILARDRAGERPLFFAARDGRVTFATEMAALVSNTPFPVNLNQMALREYLQLGIFPSPRTPFAEIRKVAPGELVRLRAGQVRRHTYWRWPISASINQAPSLEAFDQTFRQAVQRQSDADVDFGVFLSGGVDSSLVSAVARSLHPTRPLQAYTVRFAEASFDEGSFAEQVGHLFKMDLVTVWVQPEDLRHELKTLVRLVGEPLADPAWLPAALLARRAAQDVRLALVGEGADELFGGYPTYIGAAVAEHYNRLPALARSALRRFLGALPPSEKKMTVRHLLNRFAQGAELEGLARHRFWVSNIPPGLLRRLGLAAGEREIGGGEAGPLLDRVQRWDLETSLAEGLLTKADRASMSSALELRAPFLDEAVMNFAATLPARERVQGFNTKVFLKRYALRYLPRSIVHRRKRGLSVPIGRWLRGPLHDWALATLESGRLERVGIRPAVAVGLLSEHCRRHADHARALWSLLVLSEWLEWASQEAGASREKSPAPARPWDGAAEPSASAPLSADSGTRRAARAS